MSTLQKLQCDACGGHIDRASLTCNSCGMQYRIENDTQELRIITETRKTDVLSASAIIHDEELIYGAGDMMDYTIRRIAESMAMRLIPYIEWESQREPEFRSTEIYARIRVARPTSGGITK